MVNTNYDDIFLRNASLALMNRLSRELTFKTFENGQYVTNDVRFMFSAGNQEQFMKDFFMNLPSHCKVDGFAEGNYETLPFGVIHLPPKMQIQTKDMTNKFVRANFVETEISDNGHEVPVGYNARLFTLPLQIVFTVEIKVANLNHLFKVMESSMKTMFENRVEFFQYKGLRIQAQLRFPENTELKVLEQFDFTSTDKALSMTLQVIMETYFPVFDESSKMRASNVIEQFGTSIIGKQNDTESRVSGAFIDQDFPPSE